MHHEGINKELMTSIFTEIYFSIIHFLFSIKVTHLNAYLLTNM